MSQAGVRNPPLDRAAGPIVVGLGEALFDCFPDERRLGGAPVNLAIHANALLARIGGAAIPATRVGADELGERYTQELLARGVPSSAVQVDPDRPTGRVAVTLDAQRGAEYRFEDNGAWDRLEWSPAWQRLASNCHAVAFGTLAQRSEESRQTIHRFLQEAAGAVRLFDVNLRQEFYSAAIIEESLTVATAAKFNREELDRVGCVLGLDPHASVDDRAAALCRRFGLDWLALTCGAEGTVLYAGGQRCEDAAGARTFEPSPGADSVGAGDACCAGLLVGTLLDWPPRQTLALANTVGAFVASRPGATPLLPDSLLEPFFRATAPPDFSNDE